MIRIQQAEVVYNRGFHDELRALRIDDLSIDPGWCNVIGPNGAGKTTILRLLCGETVPSRGRVLIEETDTASWGPHDFFAHVQIVEQNPEKNIIPSMTLQENLRLYAADGRNKLLSPLFRAAHVDLTAFLARFGMGLETRLGSQVGLFSGGQKQAVALAGALLRRPRILLLDEFLASIDAKTAPVLLSIVREVARELAITVLSVSHELDHVVAAPGRLLILVGGEIAEDIGSGEKPITRSELVSLYARVIEARGVI